MADQEDANGPKNKQDALVEKLVPDPAQIPDVTVLIGFLGKSSRTGYWRLYLNPQLNHYVEGAEEDLAHSETLVTERNPLCGTMIWVRRNAVLQHTRTISRQAQAEFLEGDITRSFLAGTGITGLSYPALLLGGRIFLWFCTGCDRTSTIEPVLRGGVFLIPGCDPTFGCPGTPFLTC